MDDLMLPLPGLSPVLGQAVVSRFAGGQLSSDAGVLMLREFERRLGIAERLAASISDPRSQAQVVHDLAGMIRFRMLMIASGYEDGNDASALRSDPAFKLAHGVHPSDADLASQPTLSRPENWPDLRSLLCMGRTFIDLYCASYTRVPRRIVLDIDDTFDAVHGGQQLRLFNAHYDEYGFQPIVVFDSDGRFVTAMLRPAKRPKGVEIVKFLRRLFRAIRASWPSTQILIRADSHCCCPELIDFCRANGLDFIVGVAPTTTLRRHVEALEQSTQARFEAGENGTDTRFIVTNLVGGKPKKLYQDLYCRRGCAENHIKSWKTHLAADRTSCRKASANQFRPFLHAGAYWLLWAMRNAMPKRPTWRVAQFDTLRLRLVKIAARIVEMKTQVRLHLPTARPYQAILRTVLGRLPHFVT